MSSPRTASRRLLTLLGALILTCLVLAPAQARAAQLAGVQAHVLWAGVDGTEVDRQLDLAVGAGARVVRVDVGWSSLQDGGRGTWSNYHLGRLDALVTKANARGLQLLLTLSGTPCWASSAPAELKQNCEGAWWNRGVMAYAPSDPADYAKALAHVVSRYGTRVAAWELWNEPNTDTYLRTPDRARTYAAMVKAAYTAAKAANPSVKIVAGALMHADFAFTEQLYQHGIKGHFDAFSIHPYSDDRSPLHPAGEGWLNASFVRGVPAVHDVLVRHNDPKPLWLSEFGWQTSTIRGAANWLNGVDEATQATYIRQALGQVAEWDYVDAAIAFRLIDTSADRTSWIANYGLVRHDNTHKPAYAAFRAAAALLAR